MGCQKKILILLTKSLKQELLLKPPCGNFYKQFDPIVIQLAMPIPLHEDRDDSRPKHCNYSNV